MAENREELKSHLMKVKEVSEKAGVKLNIPQNKIMASSPITSCQIDGETMETVTDYFLGLLNHCECCLSSVQFSSSVMYDSVTPWTAAHQAPPPMGFSRQKYWSGLPLPSPRLILPFVPRSKHLLISWLQSPPAVILETPKNKVSHCFHCFHIYLPQSDGTRCHDLSFRNVEL